MSFCKKFEVVFGKHEVTPNMHMHAHLRDCVLDVGPVYSFWCFSFERYNGILEHLQKTWHSPEIQIMEKFTLMQTLNATDVSTSSPPELLACLNGLKKNYVMLEDIEFLMVSQYYSTRKIYFVYQLLFVQLNGHIIVFYLPYVKSFCQNICETCLKVCT